MADSPQLKNKGMAKNKIINVQGREISIITEQQDDYISLTDMARSQLEDVIIIKWLSLKNTIEYIGEWEAIYNPDFNYTEFGTIKPNESVTFKKEK
ncbi:MAG: KilA-N domain-containing protein [Bacteroidota bacterium]